MGTDQPLTPREVAELFGVATVTATRWADEGKLPSFRTPGGQRRFNRAAVEAFIAAQNENEEPAA